jgi:hypothetical protein
MDPYNLVRNYFQPYIIFKRSLTKNFVLESDLHFSLKATAYNYKYEKNSASEVNWFAFENTESILIYMPRILSQNLVFFWKYTAYTYTS